jgi:gas vesicle protein
MNAGKVVLSVVAGVAVGAVIGILYAPEKGIRTRRRLIEKGEDLRDGIKDSFIRAGDFISEKFDGTKHAAKEFINAGKSNFNDLKKEAKSAAR